MGLLDNMPDDGLANGATNFLGALGAGLLSGNRFQPIGPGFNQYMAQANRNASEQGDRASIAALLKLYGFSDEDAARLSGNRQAAELAIAKKQQDANTAATSAAISGAPSLFGGEGGGAAPRVSPAAPGGPAAGASLNGGGGSVTPPPEMVSLFNAKEQQYGLPAGTLTGMADIETGGTFNPGAHNKGSGADGLFQFIPGTAKEYGVNTRDIASSTDGAARYARDNADRFRKEMGRDPTAAELYLMHQQGGGGGLALLRNPNAPAGSLVDPRNIASNGGDPNAPASAFISKWTNRFRGGTPPVQTADASGRIGAPPAAGDGSAIQTELGPVAFTPSAVPQDPGTDTRGDGRPADAAGVNAARRDYFRGGVPPVGSRVTPPPPPPPKPLPGVRRSVDVAETEEDVQRLEGRMSMYPPSVYGATPELQRPSAARAAEAGAADMPAPGAQPAGFYVPSADGGRGRTYTGTTALSLAGQQARAEGAATSAPPPPLERATSLSDRRQKAAKVYDYWSGVLAKSGSNKPLADYAKSQLDVAKEFLKPSEIEAKLDAAGLTGTDRQQAARNMLSDNRPSNVQEYEYSRSNPGYEDFRERQRAKAEPNINAQAEQRRAVAASLGMDPNSPGYKSYIATGRMPNEDKPGPSAGDKKVIQQSEDEIIGFDNTISTLQRAKELNGKTLTGLTARAFSANPALGQTAASVNSDWAKKAEATREFQQIMSMEAIKAMSQILKGATTDAEMARFMEILGDPTTPPPTRARTIERMMTLAERQRELAQDRARDLRGGTYYNPDYGRASGQPAGQGRQSAPASARSPAPLSDLEVEARRRGLIR